MTILASSPAVVPAVSLYRDDAFGGLELIDEFVMAPVLVSAPPRLNFAGFCEYCRERGCVSSKCVDRYAASVWAVCPSCEGTCSTPDDETCPWCLWGVTEVTEAYPGLKVRP